MSIRCKEFIGTLSGNATSAGKATNDSAGQQINTTYIKGLSVSGTNITYTKGDGTTGTIKTQDTNTVYTHPTTHPASMITGLATVATSGSYNDLSNKPTIPAAYTHPTTSGNKHIPSGGSSGQILRWSADGTAAWGADNNTTYSTATQSADGLMSSSDKTKLDGIASGANKYSLPTASSSTLGGVKVGSGLSISNGVLSASGGSTAYKIPYGTCTTAESTTAKVATISNGVSFSLTAGTLIAINFANKIPANYPNGTKITLNVNSTGNKILRQNYNNDKSYYGKQSGIFLLIYDGSNWYIDSPTYG